MSSKTRKVDFGKEGLPVPVGAVLGYPYSGSGEIAGMQRILTQMQCGCVADAERYYAFCSEAQCEREIGYLCLGKAVAETGAAGWYHTVPPVGEYPSQIQKPGGKKVKGILVVDAEAYRRIRADFAAKAGSAEFAGLIVDLEHQSEQADGSTEAAAWAKELEQRPDGLWTRWDLTDLGDTVLGRGRYKYRSPAFDLELLPGTRDRYRPVALSSIGLTNTPHFKNLAPSLNRAVSQEAGMDMLQRLRATLNLPETADEEAVCSAVEALSKKDTTQCKALAKAEGRVVELETADRTREADAFISLHKGKIKDEAAVRAQYLKDPETCKGLFGALKTEAAAGQRAPRMLGRDAKTPAADSAGDSATRTRERARVISEIQHRDGCKRTVAVCRAQREHAALFAKEGKGA